MNSPVIGTYAAPTNVMTAPTANGQRWGLRISRATKLANDMVFKGWNTNQKQWDTNVIIASRQSINNDQVWTGARTMLNSLCIQQSSITHTHTQWPDSHHQSTTSHHPPTTTTSIVKCGVVVWPNHQWHQTHGTPPLSDLRSAWRTPPIIIHIWSDRGKMLEIHSWYWL